MYVRVLKEKLYFFFPLVSSLKSRQIQAVRSISMHGQFVGNLKGS